MHLCSIASSAGLFINLLISETQFSQKKKKGKRLGVRKVSVVICTIVTRSNQHQRDKTKNHSLYS